MNKCIRSSKAYYYIINPEFIYKCMCSSKVYYYIINPEFVFILINLRNTFLKDLSKIGVSFYISSVTRKEG